jgi:hypothetical protein
VLFPPTSSLLESALGLLLLHWDVEMYSTTTWLMTRDAMVQCEKKNTLCSFHVGVLTLFTNACMYTICMTYVWFKTCNFFTQESPYQSPNTRNEAVKLKWWHGITWWRHVTAHSLRSDVCKGQGRNRPQQVEKWYLDICDHWFVEHFSGSEDL